MKKIVVATHNQSKIKDYYSYFENSPFECIPIATYTHHEPEETGDTFEENALIKARHAHALTGLPSFSDDSGFCMHALGGIPGIHTASFSVNEQGQTDFRYAFEKLKEMSDGRDTSTDFVAVIAYVDSTEERVFKNVLKGYFDFSKMDKEGYGYTPIFVPFDNNPEQLSLGEMGDALRRHFSPRRELVGELKQFAMEKEQSGRLNVQDRA